MFTLGIIGSTGSIGKTSLKVYSEHKKKFNLFYLSNERNYRALKKQIKKYKPKYFYIDTKNFKENKNFKSIDFFIKNKIKIDYVVSGVSGFETLDLNIKLLKVAKNLLIANKETIICGGNFFLNEAKKNKCQILPIDSEHFCINFFLKNFKNNQNNIKKIILMASGGPFLNKKATYKENIKHVLRHPNWKMGKKITVDSATMANKVLEIFEAKILFKIPNKKIDVKIESNSLIHSIIKFKNNLNFLIHHITSMKIPIQNSLNCSSSISYPVTKKNSRFEIRNVNHKNFPLIKLGFKILNLGQAGMIIFTVINERLVNEFLKKNIFYGDISNKLINFFKKNQIVKMSKKCIKTKSDIIKIINFAKKIEI